MIMFLNFWCVCVCMRDALNDDLKSANRFSFHVNRAQAIDEIGRNTF